MGQRIEYALMWAYIKLLHLLPLPLAQWLAARLYGLALLLHPAWGRAALYNLRFAFPDWTDSERRRILRLMVGNLGRMAAQFARFPDYTRDNIHRDVVREGFEHFVAAERQGKGVLLLGGHMGAWELCPVAHALYHRPFDFLMRPLDNRRVDALVNGYRGLCGGRPIPKNESARMALRVLRAGGAVGILADQNTAPEEAVFVPFFGIPAATTTGIARLARHTGAPVVPLYIYWDPSLRQHRMCYEPEVPVARTDDEQADIRDAAARMNLVIENYVRRFPDQWLWAHRRWKNRPPGEGPIYPDEKSFGAPPAAHTIEGAQRENQP